MNATPANAHAPPDEAVFEAFGLDAARLEPAGSGLINRTWHVSSLAGEPLVLQQVNRIFPAQVNLDIDAVTRHLERKGLTTPRLVPTRSGALWLEHGGAVWRVLTRIDGVTRDAIHTPHQAREAGGVLGRFHRAVSDLEHAFTNARLGVHDTAAHVRALRRALIEHRGHPEQARVGALAEEILEMAGELPTLPASPDRVVHGDPKISNIVFERQTDRALCLIDLDTLSRMPAPLELGDAFRSWCNPATEDTPAAGISLPLFEAAVGGYAQAAGTLLSPEERSAVPDATWIITVELAVRFCADALTEHYFRWDPARYRTASAHNQQRARAQLELARSIRARRDEMRAAVQAAWRSNTTGGIQEPL